jgi:uncharacterized membrane protein
VEQVELVVIYGLMLIAGLMTITYAVNAWKIQMVTEGRAMCAAALEGLQGLLFVFAIARIIDLTSSTMGALAYVVGAFTGTAGAVLFQRRTRGSEACRCAAAAPEPFSDQPAPRDPSLRPHVE